MTIRAKVASPDFPAKQRGISTVILDTANQSNDAAINARPNAFCLLRGLTILMTFIIVLAVMGYVTRMAYAISPELLVSDTVPIIQLKISGDIVYYATSSSSADCNIKRVTIPGGTPAIVTSGLTTSDGILSSFHVLGDTIFGGYGGYLAYSVFKVPAAGGSKTIIASPTGGIYFAANAAHVFYGSQFNNINRITHDGTYATVIGTGWPRGNDTDGEFLYYIDYHGKYLRSLNLATSAITSLAYVNSDGSVFIDSVYAYTSVPGIRLVPRAGGTLSSLSADANIYGFCSDGSYVYGDSSGVSLIRIPLRGGSIQTLLPATGELINAIDISGGYLYWAAGSEATQWSIYRLPISVLADNGYIEAWGLDESGQCRVESPNEGYVGIAAGYAHSLGLKGDGAIVGWGGNAYSECTVPGPNADFLAVSAGYEYSLGLKSSGAVVAWGRCEYGQCTVPSPNTGFVAVSAGLWHSLGLKTDGSIVAWGMNEHGECVLPSPNADFMAVAAGEAHSLGLKTDGSIVAWGYNNYGQCTVPSPNTGFTAVSAGYYHNLALKEDGSVVAWGNNDYGQCAVPSPNADFASIAAGYWHSLGLKKDGSIVAWGRNDYGQSTVPFTNTGFASVAAGWKHSLALRATLMLILSAPANGSLVSNNDVNFAWSDAGADYYEIWVDDESGFSSPELQPAFLAPNGLDSLTTNVFALSGNYLAAGKTYYWKVKGHTGTASVESPVWSFTYDPPVQANPTWAPLYRLFKLADTDHFYTTSEGQLQIAENSLFRRERVEGFISTQRFASPDMVELYRFYDPVKRCHFYAREDTSGGGVGVVDSLILAGQLYEGIAGFALGNAQPGLVPLYRVSRDDSSDHLYTISEVEVARIPEVWPGLFLDPVVACWVSPTGDTALIPANPWAGMVGAGISLGTGSFQHYTKSSFSIPTIGLPLEFEHIYNSAGVHLMSQVMPLGPGWSHSYNACVLTAPDLYLVLWPDGSLHRYSQATQKCLEDTFGVYDQMTLPSAGTFEIKKKDQTVYRFEKPEGTDAGYPSMLKSIRDRNGNTLALGYEASGRRRLTTVTEPAGRRLELSYYPDGSGKADLIQQVRDVAGSRTLSFAYEDSNGNLTSFTDCKGEVTSYFYDNGDTLQGQNHQLTKIRLPRGNEIDNIYSGRRVKAQTTSGAIGSLSIWHGASQDTVRTTAEAQAIEAVYEFTPNRLVSKVEVKDIAGALIYQRLDAANPALPTVVQDRRGQVTTYAYDARGNVLRVQRPLGAESYEYDLMNNVTRAVDANSHQTVMGYDSNGNLTSVTDHLGHTTTLSRRSNGLVDYVENPLGHRTTFGYDTYGNRILVRDDLNNTTALTYDDIGRVLARTDAEGHRTSFTYNCDDQGATTTNPDHGGIGYGYDENGNLASVTDPLGHATSWTYNDLDVVASITNAKGEATTYAYNADGSLASRGRPTGTTNYSYDAGGRLSGISSSGATLTRDGNGNITGLIDANGSMSFGYDALNRLTSQTNYHGKTVGYEYDNAGNLMRLVYPGDKAVTYVYNAVNWLTSVTDWNSQTTTYGYRADGSLEDISYPNGAHVHFDYDAADRLIGLTNTNASAGTIASYQYELDGLGNIVSETRTEPLEPASIAPHSITSTYDAANRILTAGAVAYTFDGAGNMTSRTGAGAITCTYDLENRLTSISGTASSSFVYDTFGNRWAATRSGVTTRYVLDLHGPLSQVLMETDGSGNPTAYYVYGHGLVSRIGADGSTGYGFYHFNRVGSVVAVSGQDGTTLTHKFSYGPFGEQLVAEDGWHNPFRFSGWHGVMYEHGDLYYVRDRYYSCVSGSFLSEDEYWTTNLYTYAHGNPLRFIDPDGKSAVSDWLNSHGATLSFGLESAVAVAALFGLPGATAVGVASAIIGAVECGAAGQNFNIATQNAWDTKVKVMQRQLELERKGGALTPDEQLEDMLLLEDATLKQPKRMFGKETIPAWVGLVGGCDELRQKYFGIPSSGNPE